MTWTEEVEEPLAVRHSDTRTVTATLGSGNFKWVSLQTCDSAGNPKSVFAKGETVYFSCTYRNEGTVKAAPTVKVTDVDTGVLVKSYGFSDPEPTKEGSQAKVLLGSMPDKDWRLRFDITP